MARTTVHRVLAFPLLVAAVLGLAMTAASPAYAGDSAGGSCSGDTGVTVVVDASALGGRTTVRCVPDAAGMSGLDALKAAGFEVTGTRQYGDAFVCRIDGRPGPRRELSIPGDRSYQETCTSTPPADALWTYWQGHDGRWAYSQKGPRSTEVTPGGFEGWSFAIDPPKKGDPPDVAPASGSAEPDAAAASSSGGAAEESDEGSGVGGASAAPWVAMGVVVGLGGLGSVTAVRRRRARGNTGT